MGTKATVYLHPRIYKAAKVKAAHSERSLSYVVNEALRLSLTEDALDHEAFAKRAKEPSRSLKAILKDMRRENG